MFVIWEYLEGNYWHKAGQFIQKVLRPFNYSHILLYWCIFWGKKEIRATQFIKSIMLIVIYPGAISKLQKMQVLIMEKLHPFLSSIVLLHRHPGLEIIFPSCSRTFKLGHTIHIVFTVKIDMQICQKRNYNMTLSSIYYFKYPAMTNQTQIKC